MKICSNCKIEKTFSEFSKNKTIKDGHVPHCKQCVKEYNKLYYFENKERVYVRKKEYYNTKGRKLHLEKKYGMTIEQYNQLLIDQDYRCSICKIHQNESKKQFNVDHDHKTGKIRGLLCNLCSVPVAVFSKPELMKLIAQYLQVQKLVNEEVGVNV